MTLTTASPTDPARTAWAACREEVGGARHERLQPGQDLGIRGDRLPGTVAGGLDDRPHLGRQAHDGEDDHDGGDDDRHHGHRPGRARRAPAPGSEQTVDRQERRREDDREGDRDEDDRDLDREEDRHAQEREPDQEPPAPLREAVQPQGHDRGRLATSTRHVHADDVDEGTRHGVPEGDGRDGQEQAHEPGHRRPDREGDEHGGPGHPDRPPEDLRGDDGGLEDVDQDDRDEDGAGGGKAA